MLHRRFVCLHVRDHSLVLLALVKHILKVGGVAGIQSSRILAAEGIIDGLRAWLIDCLLVAIVATSFDCKPLLGGVGKWCSHVVLEEFVAIVFVRLAARVGDAGWEVTPSALTGSKRVTTLLLARRFARHRSNTTLSAFDNEVLRLRAVLIVRIITAITLGVEVPQNGLRIVTL